MYLLFDIGGTKTRFAVSPDGQHFENVKIVHTPQDYSDGLEMFRNIKNELVGGGPLQAIVGSIAASFNRTGTELSGGGPQIQNWLHKPIKHNLETILGAPAYIVNDTMMGGLAQAHFGPAQGKEISVYITVSTGIGGARIVDGKIDKNALGFEPGWQIIDAGNALCRGWSERGLLGDYVGGMGIERNEGRKPEDIHDEAFWRGRAEFLALGLYNITLMWSPDIITIGGPIMQQLPLDYTEKYYRDVLKNIFPHEQPQTALAQFGDEMGLWGALAYIKVYELL